VHKNKKLSRRLYPIRLLSISDREIIKIYAELNTLIVKSNISYSEETLLWVNVLTDGVYNMINKLDKNKNLTLLNGI